MSGESSINGSRGVFDLCLVSGVVLLLLHCYFYGYAVFAQWGWVTDTTDGILRNIAGTGLFSDINISKLLALLMLVLSSLGRAGRKSEDITPWHYWGTILSGLLFYFGTSSFLRQLGAIGYIILTAAGFLLVQMGMNLLARKLRLPFRKDDPFGEEQAGFPQEERKLDSDFSLNLPAAYVYRQQTRSSWINIINPRRGVLIMGSPGSGKSRFIIEPMIRQLMEKGMALFIYDYKYDSLTRLAWQLKDLPVEVAGRLRSDRVLYFPAPPRAGGRGRPVRHGPEFALAGPATWPGPPVSTSTATSRYGTAVAAAWDRVHPRLTHRAAWLDHDGELPVIEGTLIRLTVDRLPGDRNPPPVWLWSSRTGAAPADVDRCWQSFLRRFDLEHTFRLLKQVMGWTAPKLRSPAAADRWTWLIIACYAQLRLARTLTEDLRLPWQRPAPAGRLTPARVRRGFRNIHATAGCPASAPKPGKPGPGRPPGSKNRRPAPSYDVGKTTKRELTLKARREEKRKVK